MAALEDIATVLTASPELTEQRRWQNNLKRLYQKIRETLRDRKLKPEYLRHLGLMRVLYKPIEIGKRKLQERELRKTHYFVNPHYHSGFPFSQDAVRLRDPFLAVAKHMRKYRAKVLYVTDHDNNFFFIALRNDPPKSITKRFDISSDEWMIRLEPKKGWFRKRGARLRPIYIMNAKEEHVVMEPGDSPLLNLEMIRPCNITQMRRARILPIQEFLEQAYPFATINHPWLPGSFETEANVDKTLELAESARVPVFLEVFNGGVTPIQGFTNVWAEQYHRKHPYVPVFTGSDLHRPDVVPAGIWIRKEFLRDALVAQDGLAINLAVRDALLSRKEDDVVHRKIYSDPYKVLTGYVGKKLVG